MQKFKKYDWIKVAKELDDSMNHFEKDCEAIVIGSYADQYGGENYSDFTIFIKGHGEVSWYNDYDLELIETNREDKLIEWQEHIRIEKEKKSDLDWIFNNGPEFLKKPVNCSIQELANCFGCDDLWGNQGEGYIWYMNALKTLQLAAPFLETKNKDGWLRFCDVLKQKQPVA